MNPSVMTVENLPGWTLVVIALSQVVFAFSMLVIALVLIFVMKNFQKQILEILDDVKSMSTETNRRLPSMMGSVDDSLKNVKEISDDANSTIHSVTGTVTRVSNVVGSVAGRMESPVIRAAGALAGVAAGLRSVRGKEREIVVDEDVKVKRKKKRGLFR